MNQIATTFPKSVQPGIPKLGYTPVGWKRYRLGDLFDVVSRPVDLHDDTEYDLVTVKRSRGGIAFRERLPGKKIAVKSQFYIHEGDFLISKRQIVHGACGMVSAKFDGSIVSNEYTVLRPRKMLLLEYLGYLVHSVYMQQTFFHASIGIHVEKMIFKLDDWLSWPIHLPEQDTQQEMVNAVSAADRKIGLLQTQHSAIKRFKRGLMRRIFDGDLRFTRENGSPYPDWREEPLSKVAKINPPYRSFPNSFYYIDLDGVDSGRLRGPRFLNRSRAPSRAQRVLATGDVLFQMVRPYQRNNLWFGLEGDFVASTGYAQLRARQNPGFLYQVIQSDDFVNEVLSRCTGTGYPAISSKELGRIQVPVPCSDEQKRIAEILSSIDAKIDAVSSQITYMETFAKGLLQKMFV
ncbi:restriction endonuclease subunit S [Sulfitobacter sp. 1A13730]|uniref:restriction endonuclease subunit S n=1 Tax=Sulfitobacter sp. 1A13730 TaxID=3368569 RepID=UPI003745D46E